MSSGTLDTLDDEGAGAGSDPVDDEQALPDTGGPSQFLLLFGAAALVAGGVLAVQGPRTYRAEGAGHATSIGSRFDGGASMTESPAEFLDHGKKDDAEPLSARDRGADQPCREPRASEQLDTHDEPYGDG